MKDRKLRIAWSVACGIICLLLFALWWRSYWWEDWAYRSIATQRAFVIHSYKGQSRFSLGRSSTGYPKTPSRLPPEAVVAHPLGWTSDSFPASSREPRSSGIDIDLIQQTGPFVAAPHWFLMSVAVALSATPWIKWSKRFSLRTLLIGMTVFAILLALVLWASRGT
jgi:hypothetical protein